MKNSNRPGSLYKRCLLLLLACSILLLPLVSAHAETCPTANATVHGVNGFGNMRALADTESAKVATLSNGARVYAKPAVKGWYFVEVGSVKGYMADYLIRMDKPVTVTTLNVRTNGSNLNVRQAPATSAKVITSLKNGASVTVLEKSGVWSLIQAGTVKGYVMSKYLTDAPVVIPAPVATAGVVANLRTGVGVYLREQPSTNAKILGRFVNGQSVYLLGEAKGFYKVNVAGLIGYISKTYVKPILVVNPSPAVPPIAE